MEHRLARRLRCSPACRCCCSTRTGSTTPSPTRPSTSSSARCRSTTCSSSSCCSRTSGCPTEYRARLLFWGIVAALVLRGAGDPRRRRAASSELHFVIYVLGVLLLVLAYRILRGVEENVDPDQQLRRAAGAAGLPGHRRLRGQAAVRARATGTRYVTPLFVCLAAIVAADIAFAVDSIPAAFAITRDSVLIWMAQRLRAARPARAVRARRGPDPALPLPRRDDRHRARARRGQAADRGRLQGRPGARRSWSCSWPSRSGSPRRCGPTAATPTREAKRDERSKSIA